MDIKQLQYFVVSVDMGSFGVAAEVLITTQSNVSKVVKSLETDLSMTLLNRDRSGVTLTREGEHIYNYSIEVLKSMRMITDYRSELHMDILSICSTPSNTISNILSEFYNEASKSKEFKVDFTESNVEGIMKRLHRREIELGFIYLSKKNIAIFNRFIDNKGIKFFEINKNPLYLNVGKENPLYDRKYIEEKDLKNVKLIQYNEDQYSLYNHLGHLKEDIFFNGEKSNISYTNSTNFLLKLLRNTEYGTIGSSFLENKYIEEGIKSIPILSSENSVSFGYLKRSEEKLSAIAEEFIIYLKEQIALNRAKS